MLGHVICFVLMAGGGYVLPFDPGLGCVHRFGTRRDVIVLKCARVVGLSLCTSAIVTRVSPGSPAGPEGDRDIWGRAALAKLPQTSTHSLPTYPQTREQNECLLFYATGIDGCYTVLFVNSQPIHWPNSHFHLLA